MEITNEKEVLKKIINIINLLHPVQTPRIDLDMPSFKRPSTDIIINLIEEDNMPRTFISILDGTENFKQSVPNGNILTDAFLEINTLKEIRSDINEGQNAATVKYIQLKKSYNCFFSRLFWYFYYLSYL